MSEFQVGQKVQCLKSHEDQFTEGDVYKCRYVTALTIGVVSDDMGNENGWDRKYFKPFEVAQTAATSSPSDEFDVMREVFKLLNTIDVDARLRVISYAGAHLT